MPKQRLPQTVRPFTYGSVCSGIEAFSLAVQPLKHWRASWFSEIDPFCNAVLEARYPGVVNHGDIEKTPPQSFAEVDLIVGGTPCQSFSIQGARGGLADARGQLSLRYCDLVARCKPEWVLWENVPNALRVESGQAFAAIAGRLSQLGYHLAWRVLDSRYFGVPQRRRRLFLVGNNRSPARAAAALFERGANPETPAAARQVRTQKRSTLPSAREMLGWTGDETPKFEIEATPTLRASQGGEGVGFVRGGVAAKLTIEEWEILQGFYEGYTDIEGWGVSHRRKALGNAFPVPVLRWIAGRISRLSRQASA